MNYWPLPKRRDFICKLQSNQRHHEKQLKFQGQLSLFDVYIVDIAFPCYRLGNGRTQSAQLELIAREDLSDDFFSSDPDSQCALKRQHEILKNMVTTGNDKNLQDILRKDMQNDPLILDENGYVINGNRRLCVMRLLLKEDSEAYKHFEHVQVIFLPTCTEDDIDELEAELQWQPDGRADYSWVDQAIRLRQRRNSGWPDEKLCRIFRISKTEMRKNIAMLEDAEAYLKNRGWDGQYSRVLRHVYAFEKLQKHRAQCKDEAQKYFFTSIAYLMLDDPDSTGHRLYDSIPDAMKYSKEIAKQIEVDFAEEIVPSTDDSESGLDVLGDSFSSDFVNATSIVANKDFASKVRDVVRDTIEEKRNQARERHDATYCLREIQRAYTALENARSNISDDTELSGIDSQLNSIEKICQELRGILINGKD